MMKGVVRRSLVCPLIILPLTSWWRVATGEAGPAFDGRRAYELLKAQCALGPRVPGTRAHDQAAALFVSTFRQAGWETTVQAFAARPTLLDNRQVTLENIVARLPESRGPSAIVTAHWDSRPIADMERDPSRARQPIDGANDGASGAAVVLELARALHDRPTSYGLVLALCDGEDLGSAQAPKDWCLGSKYLAARLAPEWDVQLAINVDMVGDRRLNYTREDYGMQAAPEFNQFCRTVGAEVAPGAFAAEQRRPVFDDHASFLRARIPAVDLIDFDYPPWHTLGDT
ncbi:MAG: M28 family peptidase, partial [Candidatus Sumerlaeota bacterium]|nr:M28 family peptidase [Candidatus Sumerlaeota bacterium]